VTVRIIEAAELELDEAVSYYEAQRGGLGREFAQAVAQAIVRIEARPEAWLKVGTRLRRCRLVRFPYGVLYARLPTEIVIVAFMHDRRKPGYWRDRLKQID
jgi:toxin ParE2